MARNLRRPMNSFFTRSLRGFVEVLEVQGRLSAVLGEGTVNNFVGVYYYSRRVPFASVCEYRPHINFALEGNTLDLSLDLN